ncbi:hypothetical protein EYF80_044568 [Liparis tanakae]|uniref:Uncharacterized protein n=1 Tax=Liparis tanakae TaxID=230148 RepID=A0A4Z2FXH5_9TELE|nr:hypothetical protein EYF80_044568 [Liparis tanakae]
MKTKITLLDPNSNDLESAPSGAPEETYLCMLRGGAKRRLLLQMDSGKPPAFFNKRHKMEE